MNPRKPLSHNNMKSNQSPSLIVKFKKLHENAVLPTYSKIGDAGMDLTAVSVDNTKSEYIEYDIGIAVEIPEGYVGLVFPRSSITKFDLMLKNSVGVIDSNYRGPIKARFLRIPGGTDYQYNPGDRIAQLVIIPYPRITAVFADELSDTERGAGGFGSTGV